MRSEREFLSLIEQRAEEEKKVFTSGILPSWAASLGEWLGVNPWRVLLPISFILYIFLRGICGELVREAVLAIFGGFRW